MSDGTGVDIWAKLHASIDGLTSHVKKSNQLSAAQIQRLQSLVPTDHLAAGSVTMPASGTIQGSFSLGGPQEGRIRILRYVRVGGLTPTTTAAGRADLFQSPTDPLGAGGSLSTTRWIDQATTLPLAGSYGDRQVVLRYPDKLWVVFSSATASQQYAGNAEWEEYAENAYRSEVNL